VSPDPTRRWLEPRLRATPLELARDILGLLGAVEPVDLQDPPRALAAAAMAGLDEVAGGAGDRAEALRLLAADAALTWAFEAAAEDGTVAELAQAVGLPGQLGRRLALEPSTRPVRGDP
jgi:hypothetical protein